MTEQRPGRHSRREDHSTNDADDFASAATQVFTPVVASPRHEPIRKTPPSRPRPVDPLAVEVSGLTKTYGNQRVVDDVDFVVPVGTVLGLLGPNGAGKTTIVRMLATLLRPDAGEVRILGRDVAKESTAVRSLISLTGQYASVDNDLTALENLDIYGRLLGLKGSQARRRARELVDQFGLADAATRPVQGFSGGMRRRLDLAASMIHRPALLFLDEPTTGLDPRTRTQLWEIVRDVVAAGTTVVLTTQYLDEADALADHLVVIDHGRVVGRGTPETLKRSVGSFSLSIRLADPGSTPAAAATIEELLGHSVDIDRRTGELTAPVPDSARAAQVIAALSARRITVGEFGVHSPSLDEVFLALTDDRSKP
ncbi:ATP-binding cassette domain-containing protein [Williamsia phyllosphaerae]|uniref:Daunorubicin resistance protein DrrA family ABC transporter ATP-binding protein n=1 Tax=Williamsia phyllosphaerae TaxID=885042 RepID=A0ABQ1V1Z3_9NOCA|nr:ATP-binding cassette domain-containing protein [Williamsia phyllosphaerae]GGF31345.1 daunorubicin resistance protein DrrA family ABC transporter ATP-binding protein [Williamsia phyllosphaerae]